jgi:hypothetical protein
MIQDNLGYRFEACSIFKPNVPLAKVVEDLGKLGKGLAKQDHIVTVRGPAYSSNRHYHRAIEKYMNFTAERTTTTRVGVVNLQKKIDKPWMDGGVRRVNIWLDCCAIWLTLLSLTKHPL